MRKPITNVPIPSGWIKNSLLKRSVPTVWSTNQDVREVTKNCFRDTA